MCPSKEPVSYLLDPSKFHGAREYPADRPLRMAGLRMCVQGLVLEAGRRLGGSRLGWIEVEFGINLERSGKRKSETLTRRLNGLKGGEEICK